MREISYQGRGGGEIKYEGVSKLGVADVIQDAKISKSVHTRNHQVATENNFKTKPSTKCFSEFENSIV